MSFLTTVFATAGLVLAAGPLIIHLLNRRRFRIVDWAAMDFLREAMQRQRRILRLRDFFLLLLRTACILLFALAMAQPYFDDATDTAGNNPVHAILVVDNSLSMDYGPMGQTVLDMAKKSAKRLVTDLPTGSRFSILPLCSESSEYSLDANGTVEDAHEAIDKIKIMDKTAGVAKVLDLATAAANVDGARDLKTKHVVFYGDQQGNCWPRGEAISSLLESVGPEPDKKIKKINVVQVGKPGRENVWIEDLRVQDEVADVESQTTFLVKLRYEGADGTDGSVSEGIVVRLEIDGRQTGQRVVSMRAGGDRTVAFSHKFDPFDPEVGTGSTKFAEVRASLSAENDQLEKDNERFLVVPVLSAIPVVFIDQYGSDEAPASNKYGETYHVRSLLAPTLSGEEDERQLIKKVHVKIDEVGQEHLSDARLVVIAGVANPEPAIDVLREYVEQGGQIFIAAGGDFDQKSWNDFGWDQGAGILPSPLKEDTVGGLPGKGDKDFQPFLISFESLATRRFQVERESNTALEDLYSEPRFFKAVIADLDEASWEEEKQAFLKREIKRINDEREAENNNESVSGSQPQPAAGKKARWLKWMPDLNYSDATAEPEALAQSLLPIVLARFDNGHPMLLERRIGSGQVVFFTSGLLSDWNTLTRTNAVLVLDRILRGLLNATLQKANFMASENVRIGVRAQERRNDFSLTRPAEEASGGTGVSKVIEKAIDPEARGAGGDDIVVRNVQSRGLYVITAYKRSLSSTGFEKKNEVWRRPLAVNGPVQESDLSAISSNVIKSLGKDEAGKLGWTTSRLEASGLQGFTNRDYWKYFMTAVLVLLLIEILVLSWGVLTGILSSSSEGDADENPAAEGAA